MSEIKEKTHIANPIYDVVFRYLMEDNKVAKLVLSAILGVEVVELTFAPTEQSRKIKDKSFVLTITRMDFSARIREADGNERLIIIELQKAKFAFQILRFRRYLGRQYANPENVNDEGDALPIYPIYILGEAFSEEEIPVIKIKRSYVDVATDEKIATHYPFIEALTHNAVVIQIPYLKGKRRTDLELFLSIFDQTNIVDKSGHILTINEEDYPEKYRPVIRRLIKAYVNPKMEEDMNMEDEFINEFNKLTEKVEEAVQKEKEAKEQIKQQEIVEVKLIKKLASSGVSIAEIAQIVGKTEEEVSAKLS